MSELLAAVYEAGVLRPIRQPQLREGECVELMLIRPLNLLPPAAAVAAILQAADMPLQSLGDPQTSVRHDEVLADEAHPR